MKKQISVEKPIKGYKAFDIKDNQLTCREMSYKEAKNSVNTTSDTVKLCEGGLHFCQNIRDVFKYYPFGEDSFKNKDRVICEVEGWGASDFGDNKIAVKYLRVIRRLSFEEVIKELGFTITDKNVIQDRIVKFCSTGLTGSIGSFYIQEKNRFQNTWHEITFNKDKFKKQYSNIKLKDGDLFIAKVQFFRNNYETLLKTYHIRNITYNNSYGYGIRVPSLISLESRLIPIK